MRTSHRGPATASADPAERNSYVTLPDAQKPKPIPSLRVVRHVATAQDAVRAGAGFDMVEDLGMFVDAAARKNRASGYGYSVGSMALTLVSEREVQTMIQTSRPRIKRRDEIELRRRLAASVRQHIFTQTIRRCVRACPGTLHRQSCTCSRICRRRSFHIPINHQ